MKRILLSVILVLVFVFVSVPVVSAHERQGFTIGDKQYLFVVGALNEPVRVDDKTGVDLRVVLADPADPTNASAVNAKPVEGLDKTLKVELSAGDKKKTLDLVPVFRTPGSYSAAYYPTVATTYSYRLFGMIDNIPVDLNFGCNPAGHPATPEDKTSVTVSDKVIRTFKAGAFGCPQPKAEAGFPEPSTSVNDLYIMHQDMMNSEQSETTPLALSIVALVLSIAAVGIAKRK
jgi:hypothetical protein